MTDEPDPSTNGQADDLDDGELPEDFALDELPHQETRASRSRWYLTAAWLVDHAMLVVGVGGLVSFAVLLALGIDIPRWARMVGLSALLSAPILGYPAARKAKSLLWNPGHMWLVDIDALYQDGAVYHGPNQRWQQWEVTEGQVDFVSPNLAFAKDVDLENRTCRGTWRGTLTDRELMKALQQVYVCREMLEDDAKKGFAVDAQAWIIVRRATQNAVMSVIESFEDGSLPDEGDGISEQIDQAIEQFDIENKIREAERDPSPEADVPDIEQLSDLDDLAAEDVNAEQLDQAARAARSGGSVDD